MSTKFTTDGTSEHIDAERLAAWADHGLPPAAAAEVELHLSECELCQEVLAAFVRSEPVPAVVIPFWARRPVQWSAAGLAAAAALFLVVQTQLPTVPVADSVVAKAQQESAASAPAEPRADQAAASKSSNAALDDLKRERPSNEGAIRDARANFSDRADQKKDLRKEQPERIGKPTPMPAAPPPPPPPAAAPRAAVLGGTAGGRVVAEEQLTMDAARRFIEIFAPGPAALRRLAAASAGGGGGGGAGRGGAAPSQFRQETAPVRWRIFAGMRVELSLDAGATWTVLPIEPALTTPLVAGVAAGPSVCWLVGSEGVVLLTTDGRTFRRVSLQERVQLVSVTAEDSLQATVTAADGRKFSTVDGGLTWK